MQKIGGYSCAWLLFIYHITTLSAHQEKPELPLSKEGENYL
jgi:hypothetical protein